MDISLSFFPPTSSSLIFKEGDIIGEIAVEVETPPLMVTKPKDPEGKLREKAEAREASERRRPSSNFFTRGLTLLDQV